MRRFLIIVNIGMILAVLIFSFKYFVGSNSWVQENEPASTEVNATKKTVSVTETPVPVQQSSLENLKTALEEKLSLYDGGWAVYVKNLKNGAELETGNKKMVSASLIKLFIMAKTYDEIEKGTIEKTSQITKYLTDMITVSDNESSNELVTIIGEGDFKEGMRRVNDYALSKGYTDTEQQRDMKDSRPVPIKEQNYTSVRDCGNILQKIYKHECVSKDADEEMLNLLMRQTRNGKIPAGLPLGTKVANKTGELGDVENDVAIVFSENCDYILCVMSNELSDTSAARKNIVSISEQVYNYFNKQ